MLRRSSKGSHPAVGRSRTTISPDSGVRRPLMALRIVLLPAPLRPTSASVSPCPTARLRPRSTSTVPRLSLTSRNSIAVIDPRNPRDPNDPRDPRLPSKSPDERSGRHRQEARLLLEVESAIADREPGFGPNAHVAPRAQPPLDAAAGVVFHAFLDERITLVQLAKIPEAAVHERHHRASAG